MTKARLLRNAQASADMAVSLSGAVTYLPAYGSIEDSLLDCMFYLWALENFDE